LGSFTGVSTTIFYLRGNDTTLGLLASGPSRPTNLEQNPADATQEDATRQSVVRDERNGRGESLFDRLVKRDTPFRL